MLAMESIDRLCTDPPPCLRFRLNSQTEEMLWILPAQVKSAQDYSSRQVDYILQSLSTSCRNLSRFSNVQHAYPFAELAQIFFMAFSAVNVVQVISMVNLQQNPHVTRGLCCTFVVAVGNFHHVWTKPSNKNSIFIFLWKIFVWETIFIKHHNDPKHNAVKMKPYLSNKGGAGT